MVFEAEGDHIFLLKVWSVVSDYFPRNSKPEQDMLFQKLHDHFFGSLSYGDDLDPFFEVVSGGEDPPILPWRMRISFFDKIYLPLMERGLNLNRIQR